jgi:Tetratricopeptide repeat
MELQENDIQLLSDFWYGRLDETQVKALEKKFEADPVFAKSAKEFFIVLEGLDKKRRQKIRAYYHPAPRIELNPPPNAKIWPISFKIAAALLFIAVSYLFILPHFYARTETQKMADLHRKHLPNEEYVMSEEEELEELYLKYDAKKYKNVAPKLAKFYAATNDSTALLFSGISYFLAKNDQKAVEQLRLLTKSDYYRDPATWYLALSYLSLGDKDRAKALLKSIVRNKHPQATKAEKLLMRIQ